MGITMADDLQHFLTVALEAVKKARPIFRRSFGAAPGVVEKRQGAYKSPVTDIDKKIETTITAILTKHFPDHSISGEEFPAQKKQSPYTWYIDPIDGTINYIRGLPAATISVGLWEEEAPLIGVVFDPVSGDTYSAMRGEGALKNGRHKLAVSSASTLAQGTGGVGRFSALADNPALQRVAHKIYRGRQYGGSALELCYIAEGKLDLLVSERIKIYDVAAGMLVLTEAGGNATDWEGKPFVSTSTQFAASNGHIHSELLRELKG
ncbi:MAG: inositol monophosphatase [Candidatus Yonathbacteria bacterium]|nr:inositol monophosphatase [Candidatus Yonathbacteria bacterium]